MWHCLEKMPFRASQNGQCRCRHVPLSQRNRSLVLVDEESFCQAFLHPPLSAHLPYLAHHSLPLLYPFFPGRKHLELDLSFGEITINWGFWLHDELNFWYIPATMMLYLFAPAYMELIKRHPIYRWLPVVMIMWCILVQYVTPIHQAVGHLEISGAACLSSSSASTWVRW